MPSESVEPEPSKLTATLVTPVLSGPAFATGGTLGRVVLLVEVDELVEVDVDELLEVEVDELLDVEELVLVLVVCEVDVELVVDVEVDELDDVDELVLVLVVREVEVELLEDVDVELLVDEELLVEDEVEVLVVVGLPGPSLPAHADEQTRSANAHAAPKRTFPPGHLILRIRLLHTFEDRQRRSAAKQAMCRDGRSCSPESLCRHPPPPHRRKASLARSVLGDLPFVPETVNATEVVRGMRNRSGSAQRRVACAPTTSCRAAAQSDRTYGASICRCRALLQC